jgi:tetratricopeptide (TPR) repeat protein
MHAIPDKLIEAIKKNNLVVFAGAGTSVNLKNLQGETFGGWCNLVKQIILHLNGNSPKFECLLELLNHYEPITVLDLIEKSKDIERKDIYDFVKEFFELNENNDYSLHKKISRLCNRIITTNYDTAFEYSNKQLRNRVAYKGKNYELTTHKDDKPLLFKLHGCFSDVGSMVLFPGNYNDLYIKETRDAKHTLAVLKNLVFNKNILFIGCGMGDFQINHIFKEIKDLQDGYSQPHFIISKQKPNSSFDFLTHVPIDEYQQIDEILNSLIEIKGNAEKEKDEAIMEQQKQIAALEKSLNDNKSKHKNLITELFQEAIDFVQTKEFYKASKKFEQISGLEENDVVYTNWGSSLGALAKTKKGKEVEELYHQSFGKYQKAIEIKPDSHEAYNNWGVSLGILAMTKEGQESEDLYHQSFDKFQKAIEIKPDNHEAYKNWGTSLGALAKTKEWKDAEDLYHQSFDKFQKAIEIKPDNHEAYNNWGNYLGALAKTKEWKDAEELYHQSFDKYQKAIEIKPDNHQSFFNWGNYFGELAKTKAGQEAEDLYHQSFDKYQKAIEIKPDNHEAFYNWGIFLGNLAKTKAGQESEDLYHQSFDKYQKAVEIKPDNHEALYNWGTDLGNLAKTKAGKEAEDLYHQSFEKYQKAFELGGKCYNLACFYAIKDNKQDALFYLDLSLKKKEISTSFVQSDEDWTNFLQDKDFIEIMNKYSNQSSKT